MYASLNDYEKALPDFSKAIELNQYFTEAYFNRGKVYQELGMKTEAIADFEKFISLSNDQARKDQAQQYINELSE